ncbi:MAG: hypothetical protein ATN35_01605 [Epulopiscium sp. Nele67-Bin004]|nr:MAG: hypothetical protein ATN35_01605 [Epulopiscium sp. Nele67-Bin004]
MWRIIDIGGDDLFLHTERDSLVAVRDSKEQSRVHFSDIHSIICHSYGAVYSDKMFKKCLEFNIPLIICDDKHTPQGMLLPFMQHTDAGKRFKLQLNATVPQKKRAWKMIIEEKLRNQAKLLEAVELPFDKIKQLSKHVLSGDSDNKEAQGARIYFQSLFGKDFLRTSDNEINALLNYAYTVLRSCVARAVIGAGLHPSLGLHHSANHNPYCLVDDLMEPFRPFADGIVLDIIKNYDDITICPQIKKDIIHMSKMSIHYQRENLEFTTAMQYYTQNFFRYLEGGEMKFPKFDYDFAL